LDLWIRETCIAKFDIKGQERKVRYCILLGVSLESIRMKRGKDDEKVMGPMFPRLHVNDTEKGGPRAPPRNKMALYEQFSIPSQRFNSGVLPLNPNISSNTAPPASSSQVLIFGFCFCGHAYGSHCY